MTTRDSRSLSRHLLAPLPVPLTPLVGRDALLAELLGVVDAPWSRLVTLTGPVGVGKTRLALELAHAIQASGVRRVGLVRLGDVGDVDDAWAAVAAQLGLRVGSHRSLADGIRQHLEVGPLLLVVDNIQQRPEFAVRLARMVEDVENLCVVATGLRPLRLRGERRVAVDPLPVPGLLATDGVELDRLARQPAVAMFLDRVMRHDPRFRLTAATAPPVVTICRNLDGLPLSLELAAARLSVLGIDRLAEEVGAGRGLKVLDRANHDAPARHASLRAALEWSYGLLDDSRQALFRALTVVEGPFELELVLALQPADEGRALDAFADLLEAHFVVADHHDDDGPPRFAVPGLLREFGRRQLETTGETDAAERGRAAWCRSLAVEAVASIRDGGDVAVLRRLAGIRANLAAAVRWACRRGDVDTVVDLFLAGAMLRELLGYDPVCDGHRGDIAALIDDPAVAMTTDRRALTLGWAAHQQIQERHESGHLESAPADLARAVELARQSGDPDVRLVTLSFVVRAVRITHDMAAAEAAVQEGRGLARRVDRPAWVARFEAWSGMLAEHRGDVVAARRLGVAALATARAAGDSRSLVLAGLLCRSMAAEEAPGLVLPHLSELLDLAREVGDRELQHWVLGMAAGVAAEKGEVAEAAGFTVERLELLGPSRPIELHCLSYLVLAGLAARVGHLRTAVRLHGFMVDAMPEVRSSSPVRVMQQYTDLVEQLRQRLGATAFDAEVAAGRDTGRAGAFATALSLARELATGTADEQPAVQGTDQRHRVADEAGLAPRQREVLTLLAEGLTDRQIARRLGVSHKTVMNHNAVIYRKLGVSSRAAAAAWLLRGGVSTSS